MNVERIAIPLENASATQVTAAVHTPDRRRRPSVLLAHGAGGDLDGVGLVALAETLARRGHRVVRTNLPHREAGLKTAPRADRSASAYSQIVRDLRQRFPRDARWVLGGKSYGGRVASLAVADGLEAVGLLFYGYPLHPPGRPERLRVDHWPRVGVPCLFLQGDHDSFCDLELLEEKLTKLPRRATLRVVEGGDHSLDVAAKRAPDGVRREAPEVLADLDDDLERWLASLD